MLTAKVEGEGRGEEEREREEEEENRHGECDLDLEWYCLFVNVVCCLDMEEGNKAYLTEGIVKGMVGGEISGELSGEGKKLSWILYFLDLDLEDLMFLGIQNLLMESK